MSGQAETVLLALKRGTSVPDLSRVTGLTTQELMRALTELAHNRWGEV